MIHKFEYYMMNHFICKQYDVIIVGAGIVGSTIAYLLNKKGLNVCVLEKRSTIGGNCYTESSNNIDVHAYGAHIFRTSKKSLWDFVNQFHPFKPFNHRVIVDYNGKKYSFPINLMTLYQISNGDIDTPIKAKEYFDSVGCKLDATKPDNLQDHCIAMVGEELFNIFIKGYTEKQWGKPCSELPSSIIKRIPVRTTFNDNYFADSKIYQGIPEVGGYTAMFDKMLDGIDVYTNCDYLKYKDEFNTCTKKVVYTGAIDELFDYKYGQLEWRSLEFVSKIIPNCTDYQGVPVVNYTSSHIPYTRIIEHKHFCPSPEQKSTIITYEYPKSWSIGLEKYYPMNDIVSMQRLQQYKLELLNNQQLITAGRLTDYAYYDMDVAMERAIKIASEFSIE